jgi:DNA polymerase III epsilon subunit-like protein
MSNKIIVFDTETTGFSAEKNEIVQLSYILYDTQSQTVIYATQQGDDIVKINGKIPKRTTDVHGITKEMTLDKRPIKDHIDNFIEHCNLAETFVGHNISFDIKMIVGQIKKIIQSFPEEEERYEPFLSKFQMVGKDLPDAAFCTMEESKGICAQIRGTNRLKKEKLMEVHKLLFGQDVGGQLHNALVDISVTLRVYLKLTLNIDICSNMDSFDKSVINVRNNNEICSLINPARVKNIENVDYSGELITGLTVLPEKEGIEEKKIMVNTIVQKMAAELVEEVQNQGIRKIVNKSLPPNICTNITICRSIIKSGLRKGEVCGRVPKIGDFCLYHKPKKSQVAPITQSIEDLNKTYTTDEKPNQAKKLAANYVTNLFKSLTRKNNSKIVPLGGKRNKTIKRKSKKSKKLK